ncbi:MAG: 30S ribosome-binding factor RbfA [Candidatus Omnitrophica bacterium]|nr:30S ribosome-binding factor RbfA [Candidatus Omnitrophota bacterium]
MSRMDKVNEQVKREISLIVQQELGDPRMQFVTITKVEVSADLRNARVFFSVMGTVPQTEAVGEALEKASGVIRRHLGQRIEMRYLPALNFIFDKSIAESIRLEKAMQEIQDEREHEKNHSDS